MEIEQSSKENFTAVDESEEIERKKESTVVKSSAGPSRPKGFELPW